MCIIGIGGMETAIRGNGRTDSAATDMTLSVAGGIGVLPIISISVTTDITITTIGGRLGYIGVRRFGGRVVRMNTEHRTIGSVQEALAINRMALISLIGMQVV